ncbi:SdpI family protein [Patescibacteria group bacterium]|nr:SdpI family protein [Patescibacteria group bacterium]
MKINFRSEWFSIFCFISAVIISLWAYPHLPAMVPSHWNIQGQIDGYMTRLGHTIGVPGMILGIYILFLAIPVFEPRRQNFFRSIGFYQMIRNFMMGFMLLIYMVTTWIGVTGEALAIGKIVPLAVGILFIFIGNYLSQIKSNFFMGIRTPWTLSSDTVWQKTHRLGGYTFVIGGLLFMVAVLFNEPWNFYLPMTGILLAALVPVVYSYISFRQEQQ